MNLNPAFPFYRSSQLYPERLAMVDGHTGLTYRDAADHARAIAQALQPRCRPGSRVAILGSRSVAACLAVLGICWSGATYVPLGLKLPEERLVLLLQSSGFDAVICDRQGEALLTDAVLAACPGPVLLADPGGDRDPPGFPHWRIAEGAQDGTAPVPMQPSDIAYIEFTSGTTGTPKGVVITAGGLHHYLTVMQDWYGLTPEDRVAETSDLSFDISVSNMFLTWNAGAALYIAAPAEAMAPVEFIRKHKLTLWYSVPSIVSLLQRSRTLRPGILPSLRRTVFAGEPLPAAAATAWLEAAPHSTLDNLYGPTEATVVCLRQVVTNPPRVTAERGIVAIGRPYPGMDAAILGDDLRFLPPGEEGEIALSGPQLAAGYLNQPELTAARFPMIGGRRWYLTGDRGYQDSDGVFHHLGRFDNQVKVLGIRIELEEIEHHLRRASHAASVAAVAWPMENGSGLGIVGFVAGTTFGASRIRQAMRKFLPGSMVPNRIIELEHLPLNGNGKIDRRALVRLLDQGKV